MREKNLIDKIMELIGRVVFGVKPHKLAPFALRHQKIVKNKS